MLMRQLRLCMLMILQKSADVQSVISEKAAEYAALQSGVESAAARGIC